MQTCCLSWRMRLRASRERDDWHSMDRRHVQSVGRLHEGFARLRQLLCGEVIETALSLAHAAAPCWAAVDAGNLAALPVLPGIETLTIGADNDPAGRQAARRCATRWARAGRAVYVVTAPGARADLNDLAREVA